LVTVFPSKPTLAFAPKPVIGVLLVVLGAIGFASKAIMVKILYHYQVDTTTMLTLRMLFSVPFFLAVIGYYWPKVSFFQFSIRDRWLIILLAFVGYYLSSFLDFLGLRYISAGLERLILFIYPTIVVFIVAVRFHKPITRTQLYALLLTYGGIGLALLSDLSLASSNLWLGVGLIFCSALTYSTYIVGSGQLIPRIGSSVLYTSYVMVFSTVAIVAQFLVLQPADLFDLAPKVYELNIWMALVATVAPAFLTAKGIRLIGSGNAAIAGSIGPVSTIVLANIFLGEPIMFWQVVGTALVLAGVLLIGLKKG
jgi:drug/metabolite transporter (DMT)-like permease